MSDQTNLALLQKKDSAHSLFCYRRNSAEGLNIRRHLENMVATYGASATTQVVLRVLKEEIAQALKTNKRKNAQKVG